jgi:hypothetical protein
MFYNPGLKAGVIEKSVILRLVSELSDHHFNIFVNGGNSANSKIID